MIIQRYLILCQWGKGLTYIHATVADREQAFSLANNLARIRDKQYKRSNVPAFYVVEVIGKAHCIPKANFTKEQQKVRREKSRKKKCEFMAQLSQKLDSPK